MTTWTTADFVRTHGHESDRLEFKQGVPAGHICETVTAFSNASGGSIFLGVADDGRPVGLQLGSETVRKIHSATAALHDPGRHEVVQHDVEGRAVLEVVVQKRTHGFTQMPDGRVLVRRGSSNVALMGHDLAQFIRAAALVPFELSLATATVADTSPQLLAELAQSRGWSGDVVARLHDAGFSDGPSRTAALTVAGSLFLLPRPGAVLGKAFIELFRYRDEAQFEDLREELAGPAHHQVEGATSWVMRELGREQVLLGTKRQELERLPRPVVREAVANAVAHRNYEMPLRPIRIEVRPGRVTVTSPGGLPESVTLENIREVNAARNAVVINTLRHFKLTEDAGRGVDLIQDAMADELLDPPRFGVSAATVTLTLPTSSAATARERAQLAQLESEGAVLGRDSMVLLQALRGRTLTNRLVRQVTSWDSVEARASLARLRDAGLLDQHGTKGGAAYTWAHRQPVDSGAGLDALLGVVARLGEDGSLTNESVRSALGVDRVEAGQLLKLAVEQGVLYAEGSRRWTRYRRVDG